MKFLTAGLMRLTTGLDCRLLIYNAAVSQIGYFMNRSFGDIGYLLNVNISSKQEC